MGSLFSKIFHFHDQKLCQQEVIENSFDHFMIIPLQPELITNIYLYGFTIDIGHLRVTL